MQRIVKRDNQVTPDMMLEIEALWVYRYMKHTGQEVGKDYPSAKIQAFKELCLKEGDYKMKTEEESTGNSKGRGLYK